MSMGTVELLVKNVLCAAFYGQEADVCQWAAVNKSPFCSDSVMNMMLEIFLIIKRCIFER